MIGAALAAASIIGGCAPQETSAKDGPAGSSPSASNAASEQERQRQMADYAEVREIEDPPTDTPLVRWISPDEYAPTIAECMTAAGFTVQALPGGGLKYSGTAEQAAARDLASYVCRAQYPVDPKYYGTPTLEDVQATYDYYVDDLVPCLEGRGFSAIDDAPSFESFKATFGSAEQWTPYDNVPALDEDEWFQLEEACPQTPSLNP